MGLIKIQLPDRLQSGDGGMVLGGGDPTIETQGWWRWWCQPQPTLATSCCAQPGLSALHTVSSRGTGADLTTLLSDIYISTYLHIYISSVAMQTPASYHVPHVSSVMRGPDKCEDVADNVC